MLRQRRRVRMTMRTAARPGRPCKRPRRKRSTAKRPRIRWRSRRLRRRRRAARSPGRRTSRLRRAPGTRRASPSRSGRGGRKPAPRRRRETRMGRGLQAQRSLPQSWRMERMSEPAVAGLGGAEGESEEHGIGNGVWTAGQVVNDGWWTCRLAVLLGAADVIVDSHLSRWLSRAEMRRQEV